MFSMHTLYHVKKWRNYELTNSFNPKKKRGLSRMSITLFCAFFTVLMKCSQSTSDRPWDQTSRASLSIYPINLQTNCVSGPWLTCDLFKEKRLCARLQKRSHSYFFPLNFWFKYHANLCFTTLLFNLFTCLTIQPQTICIHSHLHANHLLFVYQGWDTRSHIRGSHSPP